MVIRGVYCSYCYIGDGRYYIFTVIVVIGEFTFVTVIMMVGGDYYIYFESGDRGKLL
jgi:hypothetical protein